jgi:hypothetical protein
MMDKGSWDAVRFVPYKKGESQRVSLTPSPGNHSTSDTTPSPDGSSTTSRHEDDAHYADLDYENGLVGPNVDEWIYHPKNDTAIHHILQHCEDTPANKIEGIKAARDAMNTLIKHYAISTELEKLLVAEKLWTTTYASTEDMTKYTDQFADTWRDIVRLKIDIEFLVRSLMVHQLGEHYESFQQRKREGGISKLTIDDLTSQLLEEELAAKKKQTSAVMATNTKSEQTQSKGKKNSKKKGHDESTCSRCEKDPEECWFMHPEKAPEWWRLKQDDNKNKNKNKSEESDSKSPNYYTGAELVCFTRSDSSRWTLDSSANPHVCNDARMFMNMRNKISNIEGTTGTKRFTQSGTVKVPMMQRNGSIVEHTLHDVIYNPDSPINICSLLRMYNNAGYKLDMNDFNVKDKAGKEVAIVYQDHGIMMLRTGTPQRAFATTTSITPELLHRRMGHLGYRNVEQLVKVADGIKLTKTNYPKCECCSEAKLKKRPFGKRHRATRIGEITHIDLVPKITPTGYDGSIGYISMTDDFTASTRVRTFKSKSEAAAFIKEYNAELKTHYQAPMATIYSDLDGVITSKDMKAWMASEGITHEPTVHDTPEENGMAEITQFHLHEKVTAMLIDANLPKSLWPLALDHATYLKDRSPAKRLDGKTPYEQWHQKQPDLSHLNVFGAVAYYGAKRIQSDKFGGRGERGRFVGYDSDSTIHLIWIEGTKEIRRERNIEIHEECEPYDGHKHQEELEFHTESGIQADTKNTTNGAEERQEREHHNASIQRKPVTIQNSPHEREMEETHELNSGNRETAIEDEEFISRNADDIDCNDREPSRSRTASVIQVESAQEPMQPLEPMQPPEPTTSSEPMEEQPRRHSTRSKQKPDLYKPPSFLTTHETPEQQEAFADVRKLIALTGAPEEQFYTLYTTILDEINHAHQSFYSYLDEAMEQSAIIANTIEYDEPDLNDPEPKTFDEAMARPDGEKWKGASDAEMEQHKENETFELVELPAGRTALDGKWVYKIKRDAENRIAKYKARLVARGFMQQFGIDYDQTYAGVVRAPSIRTIFALAAFYDHDIIQLDFVTAYLNSNINEEIYMKQAPGYVQKGKEHLVYKVNKGLYGLKQSAREWSKRLTDFLTKIGFHSLTADNNVLIKGNIRTGLTMTVYVDDVKLIGSDKQAMKQVIKQLSDEFKVKDLGNVNHYLGMKIQRDRSRRTITLSQRAYIEKILDKYGYSRHGKTVKTPMITGQRLEPFDGIATAESKQEFAAQLGSVMYAMTTTRLDIAFAVSSLAQHTNNPGPEHWKALQRIFHYLRSTIDFCITLGGATDEIKLAGYTDASFAEDSATKRSTGAYVFTLNGGPISWASRRQPTVALSTTEAEYMAMCQAIREASWLRQLLIELGVCQKNEPIEVHADNKSAIALGKNPEFHKRSKHIDVQYHYVREQVQNGQVVTPYLSTAHMVADGLTKALSPELHQRLISHCRLNPNKR